MTTTPPAATPPAASPPAAGTAGPAAGRTVKKHPIRGALWGLLMGLGIALILVDRAVIALGTFAPWVVMLIFLVLGVLWGLFAPARKPKEAPASGVPAGPPTAMTPPAAEPPAAEPPAAGAPPSSAPPSAGAPASPPPDSGGAPTSPPPDQPPTA